VKDYALNLLISLDQLLNTVTGGDPDQTVSLRAAQARAKGERWGCVLCKVLDWFDPDHCDKVKT
jgi:hypothetical protein